MSSLNRFSRIFSWTFGGLAELRTLDLSANSILEIEDGAFDLLGRQTDTLYRLYTREYCMIYIEDQPYDLAPPPSLPYLPSASCHSFLVLLCVAGRAYRWERGRSQMIRRRERLYKSFTTPRFTTYLTLLTMGKAEKGLGIFCGWMLRKFGRS